MTIILSKVMKAKSSYTTQRETVVTSSFGACSFAMDDGGRCLLDVINDPKLLQSFLESGSDENSKDPQDGTSSESAESPQVSKSLHTSVANNISSEQHVIDHSDQMGYTYVDSHGLLGQGGVVCSTASGLGGMSLIVASSVGQPTYHHASSSSGTIHHLPSTISHSNLHPHSPASARSITPISHNIKSPGQGPSSVHSMPPPSPLQQTRSPLPSHTPSPAPAWSPAPQVLSPASARAQSSMNVAFQQSHNQILQTSGGGVAQLVTALTNQQSLPQKLALQQHQQQQQQLQFLQQQLSPASQQQVSRLTAVPSPIVTTTAVAVQPLMQLIQAPQSNVTLSSRTSHSIVRNIQPKVPPQILPKPVTTTSSQFVPPPPAPKQSTPTPVSTAQRTVGVGIQPGVPSQLVINQGQPGVFSGPQGTIVLNQIIPGLGPNNILIGNLGNLANIPGLQLTLRPSTNASPNQTINSSNHQNNATLIAALQGPSQHAPTLFTQGKSPIHGQQTIMIPNNLSHHGLSQNINLTSSINNSGIISSPSQGQGFIGRPNIILSPRVVGPNQGLQLQQIQTPNGPMFAFAAPGQAIAVPHLGNAHLAPVTVPMHGVMATGQGLISGLSLQSHTPQNALQQPLFGTVPFTNHLDPSSPQVIQVPQPLASHQIPTNHPGHIHVPQPHQQPIEHSPKPSSPPKPSKIPSVNLEELLKEHGIVPENSPIPSPDCHSPVMEEPAPSQSIVPSPQQLMAALQAQQLILEQPQGSTAIPQYKLAFTQDGSVIVQQHGPISNSPRLQQYISHGHIHNRTTSNNSSIGSVILPTVTTAAISVPVVTAAEPSQSHNHHSTLIARLNAAPAVSVPDVSSLATSVGIATTASITTTTITTTAASLTVPLTVQSLSVNSSTLTSSYIVQKAANVLPPPTAERVFIAEEVRRASPLNHAATPATVISSSSSVQSVQNNKVNHHTNSVFHTVVVPNEAPIRGVRMPHPIKTILPTHAAMHTNSHVGQADVIKPREIRAAETNDRTAVAPSHSHPPFIPNVPNQNQTSLKIQKAIAEMGSLENRTMEQQRLYHSLMTYQQKLTNVINNKSRVSRANQAQNLIKVEGEIEKLIEQCQATFRPLNETQQLPQLKPVIAVAQPSGHVEKPNSKVVNSHSLNLVNLLKQNQPLSNINVPKPIAPATTTITTACDSTTSIPSPITVPQKVTQVIPEQPKPPPPASRERSKPTNEIIQQHVVVRLPKPVQQQSPSPCTSTTTVPIKVPPPVKKIVNTVPKTVLINDRLLRDQNGVVNPDTKTPFSSNFDAVRRLLNYHVYNSKTPTEKELYEDDQAFEEKSSKLLERMGGYMKHYQRLLWAESMKPCSTTDQVLIEQLFVNDEKDSLEADRAAVAEGKDLCLPPAPSHWLDNFKRPLPCHSPAPSTPSPPPVTHKSSFDPDEDYSQDASDNHTADDSDPVYKEDLEAPVIDLEAPVSEDVTVPPRDDNCDRSPPTLKRIVIKPRKCSDSDDSEEPTPSRKRYKYNSVKAEPSCDWNHTFARQEVVAKQSDRDCKSNHHRYPLLTRENFYHRDNRIDDVMSALKKELDISPMEMDETGRDGGSMDGFEHSETNNHLPDFEPPVERTEELSDSNILYNSNLRNSCADKYGFDLLGVSDWTSNYVQNQANESEVAVNSITSNHNNSSDLDLSGLDGLADHLDDSRHCIPNGIQDDEGSLDSDDAGYLDVPKHHKRYANSSGQVANHCSSARDHQVQSAIRSIIETNVDTHSYFDRADILSLSRIGHNAHMGYGNMHSDLGTASGHRNDPDLEEAVRSILL